MSVDLVRLDVLAVAVVTAVVALGAATTLGLRTSAPARAARGRALAPLVPWLGGVLTLLLVVRGATAGAAVVGVLTVAYAVTTRLVAAVAGRARRARRAR